jgi:hypothetical protein
MGKSLGIIQMTTLSADPPKIPESVASSYSNLLFTLKNCAASLLMLHRKVSLSLYQLLCINDILTKYKRTFNINHRRLIADESQKHRR